MELSVVLCVLAVGSLFVQAAEEKQLVHVIVLFRHGDRSPIKAYPTDPYQEKDWPQGFGQLSQVGMRQHLELGHHLRSRYKDFLNESYHRNEISVRSTDYDRTLMSAEANLAGLYPPAGHQVFAPNLTWQPIPVHTVPAHQDRLLLFPLDNCARYQQLMNETEQTQEFLNVTKKNRALMELVSNRTGLNNTDVRSIWSVYDTLFCESKHNMTPPDWVTADVLKGLRELKDFSLQVNFGLYKQQEKSRLQGGLLLGYVVQRLTNQSAPDLAEPLKMTMLSAHDTTVMALQFSMNVSNGLQPPYASCHIFELYRDPKGNASVRMFFRNDSTVPPYPMQLPGCALDCPLQDFARITKASIPEDWHKECEVPSAGRDRDVVISLVASGCVLFLLIVLLLGLICWQRESSGSGRGYRHVTSGEDSAES